MSDDAMNGNKPVGQAGGSGGPKASKNDQSKPDLSLIPQVFLVAVARAFMVGEGKYGRYNYTKGHKASQLIAAAIRHLTAYNDGEEIDPVDGQPHLGSVGACIAMLLRQQELGTLDDNRFKKEPEKQAEDPASPLGKETIMIPYSSHRVYCHCYTRYINPGLICPQCGGTRQ